MRKLEILDKALIDETSAKAKESPRLRMNYNFHPELSDKVQRFINCMEVGTKVEIHHHTVDHVSSLVLERTLQSYSIDKQSISCRNLF